MPPGQVARRGDRYWSVDLEILHTAAREQLPACTADLRHVLDVLGESA